MKRFQINVSAVASVVMSLEVIAETEEEAEALALAHAGRVDDHPDEGTGWRLNGLLTEVESCELELEVWDEEEVDEDDEAGVTPDLWDEED